jgi:hypothetical protein
MQRWICPGEIYLLDRTTHAHNYTGDEITQYGYSRVDLSPGHTSEEATADVGAIKCGSGGLRQEVSKQAVARLM